jgi:hypothetical protein
VLTASNQVKLEMEASWPARNKEVQQRKTLRKLLPQPRRKGPSRICRNQHGRLWKAGQ